MKTSFTIIFISCCAFGLYAQDVLHRYHQNNSGLLNNRISAIARGPGHSLWVAYVGAGGEGVGVSHFEDLAWTHYDHTNSGLLNSDIRAIKSDNYGNTWFACYNAGIVKFDGNTWTGYTKENSGIVGNNVSTLHIDSENNIWIGAYQDGISRFDGGDWVNYTPANSPFPELSCINDLTTDSDGNLWVAIGCGGGLAMLNKNTSTWTSYNTANSSLQYYSVSAVMEDPSGKIWIGYPTNQNVISSLDNGTWANHTPVQSDFYGVAYDGFAIDGNGDLLCATATNGLLKFNGIDWDQIVSDTATSSFSQSVFVDADGFTWYAEFPEGLWSNRSLPEGAKDLIASTVDAAHISLAWSPPLLHAIGYILERRQAGDSDFSPIDTLTANDLAYVDTGLSEGVNYQYRVLAYNRSVPLQYSNVGTATTNITPTGGPFGKEITANETLRFSTEDFASQFADADPNDALVNVEINALPDNGQLVLDGVPLTAPTIIHIDDIDLLAFVPGSAVTTGTTFSYFVNDGKDNSRLPYDVVISVFAITSVGESMKEEFAVFPNPLVSDLVIQSDIHRQYDVTVQNPAGHELLRQHADDGKIVVHCETMSSGIYILRIVTATGNHYTRKIIKIR